MSYSTRVEAMAAALLGGTAPPAQIQRARDAFAAHWPAEILALGYDPDNLTNAQADAFLLKKARNFFGDVVRAELGRATQATVQPTVDAAAAQADTDWPEGVV